ncbi:hypothetical protein M011DRAFT_219252 [Sporormia fimetaria CBS 119925]|uniref:Fungal N-terminal domain-containing protein n=1 Tax=Sporormia fimetaria CBS 119925 TaxID=1340428 RepID=A0A6A6V313_9PLEO|nr:hypothetical protein M011DRAFT_219252 [Sporormia fimetaria CBS 119925]
MDPLSVAGSVLAVLTAAGKTSQGLERLYSLKDAPKELMCLINEVSSMRTMLKMVELLLVSLRDEDSTSLRSALHELDALHNQASAALHDLDTLIANKLKKPGKGSPETLRASSTGFLRERTTLGQMQQRFASITRSLSMGLTILNSIQIASRPQRDAVHLHVSIQSVSLANNELSVRSTADPDPLHVQLERALQGSAGPLARIAQLPAAQESAPESAEEAAIPKQAAPSSDIGGSEAEEQADLISNSIHSPPETVRLVTTIDSQKCQRFCQCQCHIRSRVQSPKWSKDILGSLYYQSNGAGWLNRRECNFRPCKRSGKTSAQITFYAPTWLMKTALYMSAVRDNRGGMNGSLAFKTPRVIPPGSMVWGLIAKGAEEQLVRYFHEGRASIYDVDIDGESLLHVSAKQESRPCSDGAVVCCSHGPASNLPSVDQFGR